MTEGEGRVENLDGNPTPQPSILIPNPISLQHRIRRWARSSVSEPSQMRVGFPKLRKEWEKELPEAELPEEAESSEEDKLG